jgi:hypothetical protein
MRGPPGCYTAARAASLFLDGSVQFASAHSETDKLSRRSAWIL